MQRRTALASVLFLAACAEAPAPLFEDELRSAADAGEALDASVEATNEVFVLSQHCTDFRAWLVGPDSSSAHGSIATIPGGGVFVAWSGQNAPARILGRRFLADGGVLPPELIWTSAGDASIDDINAHVNLGGVRFVTWRETDATTGLSQLYERTHDLARWRPANPLPGAPREILWSISGLTPRGDQLVVSVERAGEDGWAVVAHSRFGFNGTWSQHVLSPSEASVETLAMTANAQSEALVTWSGYGPPTQRLLVKASRRTSGDVWSTQTLGPAHGTVIAPVPVLTSRQAFVFWASDEQLQSTQLESGTWSSATTLFPRDGGVNASSVSAVSTGEFVFLGWQNHDTYVEYATWDGTRWREPERAALLGDSGLTRFIWWDGFGTNHAMSLWSEGGFVVVTSFHFGTRTGQYVIAGMVVDDDRIQPRLVLDDTWSHWILARQGAGRRLVVSNCR